MVNDVLYNRCSYCNSVNSPEIATHPEEYHGYISMTEDPRDPTKMICNDCSDILMEDLSEFTDQLDEGWEDIDDDSFVG